MKKEQSNMDKLIKEKLEGFSPAPPQYVWDNIQGNLSAKRKRNRYIVYRWITAAAVILIAFLAGWYFNSQTNPVNTSLVQSDSSLKETKKTETVNKATEQKTESGNKSPENVTIQQNILAVSKTGIKQVKKSTPVKADLTKDILTEKDHERTSLALLNKIKVTLGNQRFDNRLEEISLIPGKESLSETERNLIAENIQIIEKTGQVETGWKLGLQVSPGYASHVSSHSENYSQNMTYSGSAGNGNIGAGLSVQYKTGKKWSLESGIYYAQNGQKSNNSAHMFSQNSLIPNFPGQEGLTADSQGKYFFNTPVEVSYTNASVNKMAMNSIAGVIDFKSAPAGTVLVANLDDNANIQNTLLTNGEFSQVFDFVEIPFYVRYDLINSTFGLQILGGFNAGFIAGNNAYMESSYGIQNIGKTRDISPVNFSGTIGMALNYDLSKHVSLALEPRVNYYLNSINKSSEVDFRPYRIGVYTGLYYAF